MAQIIPLIPDSDPEGHDPMMYNNDQFSVYPPGDDCNVYGNLPYVNDDATRSRAFKVKAIDVDKGHIHLWLTSQRC